MTDKYSDARSQSNRINEKNDCAVIAVTILSGRKYEDIHDMFRRAGRKRGNGTPPWMTHKVLRDLGFSVERVKRMPKTVNQCESKLSKSKLFLIHTRRHVLAMRGGKVHDWTAGRRHQPRNIYRVVRRRKGK